MKHLNKFSSRASCARRSARNTCYALVGCDPIVIDSGNNASTWCAGVGVYFDVDADGVRDHVQWVRPGGDEGFLALDRSGKRSRRRRAELFGIGTPLLLEGRLAPNGFVGLAQYDARQLGGNDDGLITAADAIWPSCGSGSISRDGVSTYGEMRSLQSYGSPRSKPFQRCANTSMTQATSSVLGMGHAACTIGSCAMVDVSSCILPSS